MKPHIRWMIQHDLPQVLAIEQCSFDHPWDQDDFKSLSANRDVVLKVAAFPYKHDSEIVGFVVYQIARDHVHLVNLCVCPDTLRHGIGTMLLDSVKTRLRADRRQRLTAVVSEKNTTAQLFLRGNGCVATSVVRHDWDDRDCYTFEFDVRGKIFFPTRNRVSRYFDKEVGDARTITEKRREAGDW